MPSGPRKPFFSWSERTNHKLYRAFSAILWVPMPCIIHSDYQEHTFKNQSYCVCSCWLSLSLPHCPQFTLSLLQYLLPCSPHPSFPFVPLLGLSNPSFHSSLKVLCICVCVCVRDRVIETKRSSIYSCMCVHLCVCISVCIFASDAGKHAVWDG